MEETTWKSKTYKKETGCGHLYVTVVFKPDEDKIELIKLSGDKDNNCGRSFLETTADCLTWMCRRIRNDAEAKSIIKNFSGHYCNKVKPNKEGIKSCSDAISRVLRTILVKE